MKLIRWILLCLSITALLSGCAAKGTPPPSADVDATRQTTFVTEPTIPSVVGEWTAQLSATDLLEIAEEAPTALAALGEDNVNKLTLASTLLGNMETKAMLTVLLRFEEDGTASLLLPQSGMQQAADTILTEYNPLLATLLSSQIAGYLPPDITVPATYTQTERQICLTTADGELTMTLQGDGLTVDTLTNPLLNETESALLREVIHRLLFLRNR